MITKTYETFKYDELPEESKERVLEKQWDINVDSSWWYDYDGKTGFTAKELKRMRVPVKDAPNELLKYTKLYFDIDRDYYIQFVDADFADDEIARKFLRVPKQLWESVYFHIDDQPGRYGNTRLQYARSYYENVKDFTPKQIAILDRACEIFSDKIDEALRGLRDSYEYLTSREAIEDTIRANDYDFTLDGEID